MPAPSLVRLGLRARSPAASLYPSLWDGLLMAFCPSMTGPGPIFDLGPNTRYHSVNNPANVIWTKLGPHGLAWGTNQSVVTNNANIFYPGNISVPLRIDPPFTFVATFWWDGTTTVRLFVTDAYAILPTRVRGFAFLLDAAGGGAIFMLAGNGLLTEATCPNVVGSTPSPMSQWATIVWTCTGQPIAAANSRLWIDSVEDVVADNAGAVNAVHNTNFPTVVNGNLQNSGMGKIYIDTLLWYRRILLDAEIAILSRDSQAMFRRGNRRICEPDKGLVVAS